MCFSVLQNINNATTPLALLTSFRCCKKEISWTATLTVLRDGVLWEAPKVIN
ncbi:hypothetical protein P20495_2988 [Pseudoalteromonas sp. BSi20495]|nr:hypothetical protein P20495_2988 [Pseudoalteromonas sp. BSi20495]